MIIEGRELLDFIEQLDDVAWFKFESRYPIISIKGCETRNEDRSSRPPYTSFRFRKKNPNIISRLKAAVENYDGSIRWVMETYQRSSFPDTENCIIYPEKLAAISHLAISANTTPGQYMEKIDPSFGPLAYENLGRLTQYLRLMFANETLK